MLVILRTQPEKGESSSYMNTSIVLRDGVTPVAGCPDLSFQIVTYQKIGETQRRGADETDVSVHNAGDRILLPANEFLDTLTFADQRKLYDMYREVKSLIETMTLDNRRDTQELIQKQIFNTLWGLRIDERTIAFCKTDRFPYPALDHVGQKPHHTNEKTFVLEDYKEITAISVLAKMMVPIWGEFIEKLRVIGISVRQREKFSLDLIERTLEHGAYERIYKKLDFSFRSTIADMRKATDKKPTNTASTSYVLTHSGVNDRMFEGMIMATILVKRLATFDCFTPPNEGKTPDVMVYVYELTKRSIDSAITTMRGAMRTLPKRDIANHESEDNSSIIDHISRTSSKSIDVPIIVATAVELWEIDKLLIEYDIPLDVYNSAVTYYETNGFGVPPMTQAMVASFIGTRFGGSKCINYLPPRLYQRIVVILQIYLIRNDLVELAALASAIESPSPNEGIVSNIGSRIRSNYQSAEYIACKDTFRGHVDKPIPPVAGKKSGRRRAQDFDRINFVNHIEKIIDRLIMYTHSENMAPALWDFTKREHRPISGTDCQFSENIIQQLCRFYLLFHERRPTISLAA